MGWRDKLKLPEIDLGGLKDKATEAAKDFLDNDEENADQELTELEELTEMLNDPQQGPMFEQQFGMDISGAKEKDGVVTKDEAVTIVAKFADTLVEEDYLKDVDSSAKKEVEADLKAELGDDVDSYNNLSSDQKDALLIFIATPEEGRQEAIKKAVTDGAFSYNQDADTKQDYVLVDGSTGNVVEFKRPDMAETQAYTEVASVPHHIIDMDNDLG
ncbi:MAG: hypothetical protein ACTHOO_05565 [Alcanivorax sp.]